MNTTGSRMAVIIPYRLYFKRLEFWKRVQWKGAESRAAHGRSSICITFSRTSIRSCSRWVSFQLTFEPAQDSLRLTRLFVGDWQPAVARDGERVC